MIDYKKEKLFIKLQKFVWVTGGAIYIFATICGLVLLGKWITTLVTNLIS